MNSDQRFIVGASVVLLIGTIAYPPWLSYKTIPPPVPTNPTQPVIFINSTVEVPLEYGWLFSPPSSSSHEWNAAKVDLTRLALQWLIVLLVAVPWFIACADKPKPAAP